jgi:hypothetical protein
MAKETLHLVLKRRWFEMIRSGEKKEEYREITEHWIKRFGAWEDKTNGDFGIKLNPEFVLFQHGYSSNAPQIKVECKGIKLGTGNPEWGAEPGKFYFVIKLGEVVSNG